MGQNSRMLQFYCSINGVEQITKADAGIVCAQKQLGSGRRLVPPLYGNETLVQNGIQQRQS